MKGKMDILKTVKAWILGTGGYEQGVERHAENNNTKVVNHEPVEVEPAPDIEKMTKKQLEAFARETFNVEFATIGYSKVANLLNVAVLLHIKLVNVVVSETLNVELATIGYSKVASLLNVAVLLHINVVNVVISETFNVDSRVAPPFNVVVPSTIKFPVCSIEPINIAFPSNFDVPTIYSLYVDGLVLTPTSTFSDVFDG